MLLGELAPRTAGRWMWTSRLLLLLLLQALTAAAVASRCRQGATFSQAVVSDVGSSGMVLVPGAASLPQCVSACCELPGCDLAWLFQGRCYALSCQQGANCRPREQAGADSVLVFLRGATPQTLILESLVRGEPYGGGWRPSSQELEDPGNLEGLRDLVLLQGAQQDPPGPRTPEDLEGSPEETGQDPETTDRPGGSFNQSKAEEGAGPGQGTRNTSQGAEGGHRSPAQPPTPTSGEMEPHPHSAPVSTSTQTGGATTHTPPPTDQPLMLSSGNPTDHRQPSEPTTGLLQGVQPAVGAPPVSTGPPAGVVPSASSSPPPPTTRGQRVEVGGSSRGPVAVAGPDRNLSLPVGSLVLDGRSSSGGGRGIAGYRWDAVSGPPGLELDGADRAVATVTGLRAGAYRFRLTVVDQQGATDSSVLSVRVLQTPPPVAHASGSHTLTLPNNSLVLRGSVTHGDQTQVRYLWVRDRQSPAAGDVLFSSDRQPSLYLSNLVQGTYLFQLQVTDARGRSSSAAATVEVRPEPSGGQEVELELLVPVWQVSVAQRDTLVRQLAALLHVLDRDVQVRALQGRSLSSTVLRFSVGGPAGLLPGSRLVVLLRNQLLGQKNDFLLFRVLRVDAVSCLLLCSGRGQCDPISRECRCDPFWTENLLRRYLGDGESNCEWQLLYVILSSFVLVILVLTTSWTFICCCRRRRTQVRRKTRYTILDSMDEQERVELRPKFSIKHRSAEYNSSLMLSESELDSDRDNLCSQDRPVRSRNRVQAAGGGSTFG